MSYIRIDITIYSFLCRPVEHREKMIVGSHKGEPITKAMVMELFKKMVQVFRRYNLERKEVVKDDSSI